LPAPLGSPPYHLTLESLIPGIGDAVAKGGKLVFHTVGDTGGIKNADYQRDVAGAMKADLLKPDGDAPSFFFHLGDVVYYNGQVEDYYDQFYVPYEHYTVPIIGIPGNHDGDPADATQTSLDGWIRYFMAEEAGVDAISRDAPRITVSQPNVYWTLDCPLVRIIGLYTNVPEHGSIDSIQQQWVTNEFATAPPDKALVVALHHPVYSFDDHHSGSSRMADVLSNAINDSRRVPNLVLTAHVHNYQRIEREIVKGKRTGFLVAGNGGYYHLHNLNATNGTSDQDTGAQLVGSAHSHGYLTLTIDSSNITGTATVVEPGADARTLETFSYPTAPLRLGDRDHVSL
jgi:hypothetical protein